MSGLSKASNTLQVVSSNKAPQFGEPFPFHAMTGTVIIPDVILRNRELLPGARMLWGVIRQQSWKTGKCTKSDAVLGRKLGVEERAIRKYVAQLVRFALLRVKHRHGLSPERELLLHPMFLTSLKDVDDITQQDLPGMGDDDEETDTD